MSEVKWIVGKFAKNSHICGLVVGSNQVQKTAFFFDYEPKSIAELDIYHVVLFTFYKKCCGNPRSGISQLLHRS